MGGSNTQTLSASTGVCPQQGQWCLWASPQSRGVPRVTGSVTQHHQWRVLWPSPLLLLPKQLPQLWGAWHRLRVKPQPSQDTPAKANCLKKRKTALKEFGKLICSPNKLQGERGAGEGMEEKKKPSSGTTELPSILAANAAYETLPSQLQKWHITLFLPHSWQTHCNKLFFFFF